MNTAKLSVAAVATSLLAFAFSTQATANELTQGVAAAAGQWIAAQGNAAVQEIEKELKEHLRRSLQPLLPMPAPGNKPRSADAVTTTY
jgi:selenocysteine lyase/cysteine desulfurase